MLIPKEDDLIAFMDKLEKSAGSDALQSASHDGGFATEGTNIQAQAKKMKKALVKGGMSPSEADVLVAKAFPPPQGDEEEDEPAKTKKGFGGSDDDDSMSADDDSGDAESSDGGSDDEQDDGNGGPPSKKGAPMKKSNQGAAQLASASTRENNLRKALVDENPDAGAVFDGVPVLAQLVESIDKMLSKSTSNGSNKRIVSDIRKSLDQVRTTQNAFNSKLAMGLSMIAARVINTENLVKSIADQPMVNNRAPSLRKSDILEPSFHGGEHHQIDGSVPQSPLYGVEFLKIQEALVEICMKGGADVTDITKFENSKGNLNMLPPAVLKQLEQRLCAA